MNNLVEICNNSYKNFHAKGVDYICLKRTPTLTTKVYLFNGDVSTFPEVVNPHNHRYPFQTRVLHGKIYNKNYVRSDGFQPNDCLLQEFEWRTPLNGGKGFSWKQESFLKEENQELILNGANYFLSPEKIHTIQILENETALLLHQYEDVIAIDAPTFTFTTKKEPPSLDGLYEKFSMDELKNRLKIVEKLL